MKRFNDIRVILYQQHHRQYRIAGRILDSAAAAGKDLLVYKDEHALGIELEAIREKYESKEVLVLKEFLGRKFQKCPCSSNVVGCNYYLLNTCFNCLYDCTYCFLNSYLNSFGIIQFVNLDELPAAVNEFSSTYTHNLRVGTGEFTDSLMFDEVTGIAEHLIAETCSNRKVFLEFKTKSANVEHLLGLKNKGNTVLAWTLNTKYNIELYEKGASTLDERLTAAQSAQNAGFYTAFHFDPVIKYSNFLQDYYDVIDTMSRYIKPEGVLWISLGCFRYTPGFKDIIKHKYPDERITVEEMFPGVDGKLRYLAGDRIEIFRSLTERLKKYFPDTFIYLCMEDAYVWKEVFGVDYTNPDTLDLSLSEFLDRYAGK